MGGPSARSGGIGGQLLAADLPRFGQRHGFLPELLRLAERAHPDAQQDVE